MKISELIALLREMEEKHGDIPVKFIADNYSVIPAWCISYEPGNSNGPAEFDFILETPLVRNKEHQ